MLSSEAAIRQTVIVFQTECLVSSILKTNSKSGVSSLGVPGVPWQHPQILADQLTLSQPGGTDYAHHINTGTPEFSDLPTAL